MFRYMILQWNPVSSGQANVAARVRRSLEESHSRWKFVFETDGAFAACVEHQHSSDTAITLADAGGVVFGTLFERSSSVGVAEPARVTSLSVSATDNILRTRGRSLTERYWGSYVALLALTQKEGFAIVRGPMSPLSCFATELNGAHLVFSCVEDCLALGMRQFSINWDCIRAQVVNGDYLTAETGLNEVRSIECGECFELRPQGKMERRCYWTPHSLIEESQALDFGQATKSIRAETEYCVNAWASCHSHIVLSLSGGLDSSIVLSCLKRAPSSPLVTCVNYYSRDSGDERPFARSMAMSVGSELIENARNIDLDLNCFREVNLTARPVLHFSAPDVEARNLRLAGDVGASAIFDGELGDNVFGNGVRAQAVLSAARQSRIAGLVAAAVDYAQLRRMSAWRTLRVALKERAFWARQSVLSMYLEALHAGRIDAKANWLASNEAVDDYQGMLQRFVHPWLWDTRLAASSRIALLYGLVVLPSTSYHAPFSEATAPPIISPLTSQPLVEVALRISPHHHFRRGEDRAVARAAFASLLPESVLRRGTGKAGPDLWIRDVIERNVPFLREFLLDGWLVKKRLIDKVKLEAVLSQSVSKSTAYLCDVFVQLYIESWLRRWHGTSVLRCG